MLHVVRVETGQIILLIRLLAQFTEAAIGFKSKVRKPVTNRKCDLRRQISSRGERYEQRALGVIIDLCCSLRTTKRVICVPIKGQEIQHLPSFSGGARRIE